MIRSGPQTRRRVAGALVALAALSLVAACGDDDDDDGATATTEAADPSATTAASGGDLEAEIQEVYEAAQEEGSLMVYTTTPENQTEPLIAAFEAEYPGIDVEFIRLSTNELLQRFASEAEAGVNAADVLSTPDRVFIHNAIAGGTMTSLAEAGIPGGFPLEGFPEDFVFYDGEIGSMSVSPIGITFLTTEVTGDDVPDSFEDLLDPQWSGEIGSSDPSQAGASFFDFWDFIINEFGEDFVTSFAAQDVDFSQLPVPLAQAQAAGEYAVTAPTFGTLTSSLAAGGAPVEISIPDVTTGAMTYVGLAADAPHPNAARLYLYFTYSEEGAAVFAEPLETQGNPWGGSRPVPSGFVVPDTDNSNSDARKAEILELLGLG